jgi:transcription elongation factor GreB
MDEASVEEGRIGFVAPIARAVTGAHLGQTVRLRMGRVEEEVEVMEIGYEDDLAKKE